MYSYQTRTTTQTATQAKRLASRIGAELLQLRSFYGQPSAKDVEEFALEAELYLAAGYVETISYGFTRNGKVSLTRFSGQSVMLRSAATTRTGSD